MKFIALLSALFAVAAGAATEKCESVLEVYTEIQITRPYEGFSWNDKVDDKFHRSVVLDLGKYTLTAGLELTKERKSRCEYSATDLTLKRNGYKWEAKKAVPARLELDKKGNMTRFHINGFRPTIRRTVKTPSGESVRIQYEGDRPLYIATTFDDMDDTDAVFKGSVAYFDYSDGHEFYGKAEARLRKD